MMTNVCEKIIACLPYGKGFRFVDAFTELQEEGAAGIYTFREDEYFYPHHFPGHPVTPGVILIECMAQIGLLGLGIFLTKQYELNQPFQIAFASSEVAFLKPVFPGTQVRVKSEKVYFRFGKLKCRVVMTDGEGVVLCKGVLAGMFIKPGKNGG